MVDGGRYWCKHEEMMMGKKRLGHGEAEGYCNGPIGRRGHVATGIGQRTPGCTSSSLKPRTLPRF